MRAEALARLPLDLSTPATDVARIGDPIYLGDPADYVARYGASLAARGVALEPRAIAAVPLDQEGQRFGVLGFSWDHAHDFPPDRRAFIAAIAKAGAGALERARLADREHRRAAELEAVVGAIGEGIIVAEADGSVSSVNGAAIRILGGRVDAMDDLLDRFREADGGAPRELPGDPAEFQLRDRPNVWVEVTAYPVRAAPGVAVPSTVVVCRDVTAFRQGQRLREAFLSLLSHELRTPVTTIYGGSSVLIRPGAAIDARTRDEILADIAGESNRLYRLVEDLLVLARFDEGLDLGAEPSLLQHLVPPVVELERARWPAVRFDVEIAPDLPTVSADETSVQQVLRNLLSRPPVRCVMRASASAWRRSRRVAVECGTRSRSSLPWPRASSIRLPLPSTPEGGGAGTALRSRPPWPTHGCRIPPPGGWSGSEAPRLPVTRHPAA